jgi:hypothetical protein
MAEQDNAAKQLSDLCQEAAKTHGDDWQYVERSVRERIQALPPDERRAFLEDLSRVLRYEPPLPGQPLPH